MNTNKRHNLSARASMPRNDASENDAFEAEVMSVLSIPRGRERDLRVIELEDGALALYMELFYIPGEIETYRQSLQGYWRYIAENQDIYEEDGTPKWRQHLTTGPKDSGEAE